MKRIIIAIDGYSSSGKSTMARELARLVGYVYVDAGAGYRAGTLWALRRGMASPEKGVDVPALVKALPDISISFTPAGADGVQHTLLNGEDVEREIRDMQVSGMVSPVAEIPEVRERLTALQKGFGRDKGIVMDGRDIGTAVFPDAEMKVFVDASPEIRAERRLKELEAKGMKVDYDEVIDNLRRRDHSDPTRKVSPLRKADDAFVLANSRLSPEEQMKVLAGRFNSITGADVKYPAGNGE